jgi:hypothetical protein
LVKYLKQFSYDKFKQKLVTASADELNHSVIIQSVAKRQSDSKTFEIKPKVWLNCSKSLDCDQQDVYSFFLVFLEKVI